MGDWKAIDSAPKDQRILVWNAVTGPYISRYKDGEWPMYGWDREGTWFPRPSVWMSLPDGPSA